MSQGQLIQHQIIIMSFLVIISSTVIQTAAAVRPWKGNYITHLEVDVITYRGPPKPNAGVTNLLVKEAPGIFWSIR